MRRVSGFLVMGFLVVAGFWGVPPAPVAAAAPGDPMVLGPEAVVDLGGAGSFQVSLMAPSGDEMFVGLADDFGWFQQSGRIEARDTVTGDIRIVFESDDMVGSPFTFWDVTGDGSSMLISARTAFTAQNQGQEQLYLLNTVDGELTQVTPTLGDGDFSTEGIDLASMSADGSVVSFRSSNNYLGGGFREDVYYVSGGNLVKQIGADGSALDWIHTLGDGRLLLPGNSDGTQLSIRDLGDGSVVDVDVPEEFFAGDVSYRLNDPSASDDGSVLAWSDAGRVFVWDRDIDTDGDLDEEESSQVFDITRGVEGYYGAQTGSFDVSADGSMVMFTSEGSGFPCFSSRQPGNVGASLGPSEFEGGVAAVGWSRSTHRLSYVAEVAETPVGLNCGELPSVSLSADGARFGYVALDDSSQAVEDRVWAAPVVEMDTRDVHLTFTNILECQDESGPAAAACSRAGVDPDGGGNYYVRSWFGDGLAVETDLSNTNENGDLRGGRFVTVSETVLEALPVGVVHLELWDNDPTGDEQVDISQVDSQLATSITVELDSGLWRADDVDGQAWFRGDGDTEHVDNGGHPTVLGFSASALPILNVKDATPGDRDGDGSLDGWEINGLDVIDITQDNPVTATNPDVYTVIDPAWNAADVNVPDIFVENDWVNGNGFSAIPGYGTEPGTYGDIVESFAVSPRGINLWVDTGDLTTGGSYTVPGNRTVTPVAGDDGVDFGGGNEIQHQGAGGDIGDICSVSRDLLPDDTGDFYKLKRQHFDVNRRWVFRYMINSADAVVPGDCSIGGQAEIGGNDILNLRSDVSVMMHELGHSLNLRHGGDTNVHCKPNYVSVMNYAYDGGEGIPLDGGGRLLDYSPARYVGGGRSSLMPDLNETELDERDILDPSNSSHIIRYSSGNFNGKAKEARADENLDYSGDGQDPPKPGTSFEVGTVSVNRQEDVSDSCDDTDASEVLTDHNDWAAVTIPFRKSGEFGDAEVEVSDERGMLTDDEIPGVQASLGRVDLELSASVGERVGGVVDVEVSVRSLDKTFVNAPRVLFELGDGVSVGELPSECEVVDGGAVDCLIVSSIRDGGVPTEPVVFVLPVVVAEDVVDPSVTMSAVSDNNPVSNDPDPSNNVVTLELS